MVNKIETGLKSIDMLFFVNEIDDVFLFMGCVDGLVKIWCDYDKIGGEFFVIVWNMLFLLIILFDIGSIGFLSMFLYKSLTYYNVYEFMKVVIVW